MQHYHDSIWRIGMNNPKNRKARNNTRKKGIPSKTRQQLIHDNQALAAIVLKLRDQLDKQNTAEYEERDGFHYGIPDLRSRAELKSYMRDGFFGSNYNDRQKAFMTYKITFSLSDADLYSEINEIETEIQKEEDDKFLLERDFQVSKVREQEAEKIKLIEEAKEENQDDE